MDLKNVKNYLNNSISQITIHKLILLNLNLNFLLFANQIQFFNFLLFI
jgi:hypothetical protein